MASDAPPPSPAASQRERHQRGARRERAPGAYLPLTLWARFALAGGVALVLMVAMVLFVSHNNTDSNPIMNFAGPTRANQDAKVLIAQDQAPHHARLTAGASPAVGLTRAVRARIGSLVAAGSVPGPLGAARCRPVGTATGPRRAFNCTVESAGVAYPFAGVVETAVRRITYCKRDPPPVDSGTVPVSPLCLP